MYPVNYRNIVRVQREVMNNFCFLGRTQSVTRLIKNRSFASVNQKLKAENIFNNFSFRINSPTGEEILKEQSLIKKTCLITGGTNGIGKEMVRCLAARGCDLVMPCRNNYKAKAIANEFDANDQMRIYQINLESLKSVQTCSEEILDREKKIDIVLLNAGVFGIPWTLTENGLETIFQVNFLSQFSLLMNIQSILAHDARVVFITSESHRRVHWSDQKKLHPTEDMLSIPEHAYTSIKAYNISKLCSMFAMHYLGFQWINTQKSVFCAHPGTFVKTSLCQHWWLWEMLYTAMKPFAKNISQAAATPLYCATSPELRDLSAIYYKDCERCQESDLAQDFHFMFRIIDLCRDIIQNRVKEIAVTAEQPKTEYDRKLEEDNLVY